MEVMTTCHGLSKAKACRVVGLSRTALYRPKVNWLERDQEVIDAINEVQCFASGHAGGFGSVLTASGWMAIPLTTRGSIGCNAR